MVIALTPILTNSRQETWAPLFSPDYMDIDDKRPILRHRALIDGGYCAYIGVDALSDASTASAMVAMGCQKCVLHAVIMCQLWGTKIRTTNFVLIDEWGDAHSGASDSARQQSAMELKVILCVLGQTMSDLIDKLASRKSVSRSWEYEQLNRWCN